MLSYRQHTAPTEAAGLPSAPAVTSRHSYDCDLQRRESPSHPWSSRSRYFAELHADERILVIEFFPAAEVGY